MQQARLIVASNRLPFVIARDTEGRIELAPAAGGLVTAMLPILKDHGGIWVGWTGVSANDECDPGHLSEQTGASGFGVIPISLTDDEVTGFYEGFSNQIIWPLFHDLPSFCNFEPSYWQQYLQVTKKFANAIVPKLQPKDFIWIHDYHLMNVAADLRRLGVQQRIGFFLHIPFPSLDLFLKLPWRDVLLRSLLEYDLVGFQTQRDKHNFLQCLRYRLKDLSISGKGQIVHIATGSHRLAIGHFPISIDFTDFARRAASDEVKQRTQALHDMFPGGQFILGVDRLDYSKGIVARLKAFREALIRYPELRQKVTLIQVVVPSREHIARYGDLRTKIEQMVSRVNGEFSDPGGWVPIHYIFRQLDPLDLLAYYRAAEIALITPLKDGMNLVAKEYCTCSIEGDSVLILSEFAGAAAQLRYGALLINPFDIEGTAEAIYRACTMPTEERRWRMHKMRREISRRDVFWWLKSFLSAAEKDEPDAFADAGSRYKDDATHLDLVQ